MKNSLRCLLLLICSASAYAETITWLSFNRPPWFMDSGNGYGDQMQARYIALLPKYEHKSIVVNLARMNAVMKQGRNFCISALADLPAFRQYVHMSKTLYILPRPKIFMRQDVHIKMGRPAALSIKKLAANTHYRMGLIRGTTYLPIRADDYAGDSHVTLISSSSPIISIMQMVDLGRIDWAADYPHMVQWGVMSEDIELKNTFAMADIEEFKASEVLRSGIACTKNSWGRGIIDQLNERVQKDIILDIREDVAQWMPPGGVKEEFYKLNMAELGY